MSTRNLLIAAAVWYFVFRRPSSSSSNSRGPRADGYGTNTADVANDYTGDGSYGGGARNYVEA